MKLELHAFPLAHRLLDIVTRLRRMFDLDADPHPIAKQLSTDCVPYLLSEHPGMRMPSGWDGFELAVRAILGQQISVSAATTIAGRVASMCGSAVVESGTLNRLFPTPMQLANAPLEQAGIIAARAGAIRGLARRVAEKTISFGPFVNQDEMVTALRSVPGIGEWTASGRLPCAHWASLMPSRAAIRCSAGWPVWCRRASWTHVPRRGGRGAPTPSFCCGKA